MVKVIKPDASVNTHPKKKDDPAGVHITEFQGKTSETSMGLVTVHRVSLFGINGVEVILHSLGLNEFKAQEVAKQYSELTGWPIRRFKESSKIVITMEEVLPVEEEPAP